MRQPNRTRQALLGFLTWGPMSGYDIRRLIDGSISNFWSESPGRIYPMLAQLVSDGLATQTETATPGGRPRNVYEITDSGRAVFSEWLGSEPSPRPARNELLLKLFFGARGASGVDRQFVLDFRSEQEERLSHYASIRADLEAAATSADDLPYWLMTLRWGELEATAQLEWADETLAQLRELGGTADEPGDG